MPPILLLGQTPQHVFSMSTKLQKTPTKRKSLNVLQNVIFDRATVQFKKIRNYIYEVRYKQQVAGTIVWDQQSGYWIYGPTRLLPQAPGLHASQIFEKLAGLKQHLQTLV